MARQRITPPDLARATPGEVLHRGQLEGPGFACAVSIPIGQMVLRGDLAVPERAVGLALFAHGSGSSGHSPRNRLVARALADAGTATLLFDLLTPEEEAEEAATGAFRFDIRLLAERLVATTKWVANQPAARHLGFGYFGSSTGAAAALVAAAELGPVIDAVVSRGGRPDLASPALPQVEAATLLIVGARDEVVLQLNQRAYPALSCEKRLVTVPRATHLFEEPGALEEVARLTAGWFRQHLKPR